MASTKTTFVKHSFFFFGKIQTFFTVIYLKFIILMEEEYAVSEIEYLLL